MKRDAFHDAAIASVFEDVSVAIIVIDREGVVRIWSPGVERLTGWTAAEAIGRPPPYLPVAELDGFRANLEVALAQSEVPDITVPRHHKDGSTVYLRIARSLMRDANGRPIGVLGIVTDVTRKQQEEHEQRRSEENLRTLIERSPDAIIVHRSGRTIFVNQRAYEMLGYQKGDLLGGSVLEIVHPDDRAAVVERATGAMLGREAPPLHERLLRRDGSVLDVEVIALPITFDGAPAVLAHARDLTERMRFEAALRTRDRLASVGRIAAAVGHEINNPLAYVMGSLELLARRLETLGPAADELDALVANAREGAERVRVIVRDLRTFSQREPDAPKPVDMRRVLESCVSMAQHEIRHRARLSVHYGDVPRVMGNEARLGQVFLNLLVNAAQAIPEGHVAENEITLESRCEGGEVVVEVRDTGGGLAPDVRARLFEPFFSTKPAARGSGLGLSISLSIVESLGGRIRVDDAPGGGTSVTVTLPPAPAGHPTSAPPPPPTPRPQVQRRILIVDDEPFVAATLAALLDSDDVTLAGSGEHALERLLADDPYDVVICDLMMPAMNGIDLYERVRELRPGVERTFIFMTGGAFTARGTEFLQSFPNPCLEKPFESQQVLDAVARVAR